MQQYKEFNLAQFMDRQRAAGFNADGPTSENRSSIACENSLPRRSGSSFAYSEPANNSKTQKQDNETPILSSKNGGTKFGSAPPMGTTLSSHSRTNSIRFNSGGESAPNSTGGVSFGNLKTFQTNSVSSSKKKFLLDEDNQRTKATHSALARRTVLKEMDSHQEEMLILRPSQEHQDMVTTIQPYRGGADAKENDQHETGDAFAKITRDFNNQQAVIRTLASDKEEIASRMEQYKNERDSIQAQLAAKLREMSELQANVGDASRKHEQLALSKEAVEKELQRTEQILASCQQKLQKTEKECLATKKTFKDKICEWNSLARGRSELADLSAIKLDIGQTRIEDTESKESDERNDSSPVSNIDVSSAEQEARQDSQQADVISKDFQLLFYETVKKCTLCRENIEQQTGISF